MQGLLAYPRLPPGDVGDVWEGGNEGENWYGFGSCPNLHALTQIVGSVSRAPSSHFPQIWLLASS